MNGFKPMLSSRLFWKLFISYVALTALSTFVLISVLSDRFHDVVIDKVQNRLLNSAIIFRSQTDGVFGDESLPNLQQDIVKLGKETGTRLTFVDVGGNVIADSDEDPSNMDNHRDRQEINIAAKKGVGISQRPSQTLGIPMMYLAMRFGPVEAPRGYVRVSVPMKTVDAEIASVQRIIWATSMTISLIAMAFIYVIVAHMVRPLTHLNQAVEAITKGKFKQRVDDSRRDEFGALAKSFNTMSQKMSYHIDELHRQQAKIEKSSELLQTVLASMVEGVVVIDKNEAILFANDAAQQLLGLDGKEQNDLTGRSLWEFARHPMIREVVAHVTKGAAQEKVEFELPRQQVRVALWGSRLRGEPCPGVVLVLQNVTELRRLERIRQEFVSNASHELKTPLSSIQAYAETLLSGAIDDPDHNREFVRRIEEQSERLHALVIDLLSLARIESQTQPFEISSLLLADTVHDCVDRYGARAESKNLTLTIEGSDPTTRVVADAEGLRTVMDNLVDNAVKYAPEGGRVAIRWHHVDNNVCLEVEDNGPGIPQEHHTRVFERFYRVDKARSRELGGTGLGLSIVKHITQVFGGRVGIQSKPGAGSTFQVFLKPGARPVKTPCPGPEAIAQISSEKTPTAPR